MLQFSQALLYEENHFSPLSEMLIMRSLRNPYVVGQAFFWSLKGNLYLKTSHERYYVLLEQFLMTCGRYLNELLIQNLVNKGLKSVMEVVFNKKEKAKTEKNNKKGGKDKPEPGEEQRVVTKKAPITQDDIVRRAREQLAVVGEFMPCLFTIPIEPKFVASEFMFEKLKVFTSAKSPLLVVFKNQDPGGDQLKVMFKNGDDLRQDTLTLQMIDIMDRIWLDNDLDLAMTPYKVMGTDCMQGYLEFNLNSVTLAYI